MRHGCSSNRVAFKPLCRAVLTALVLSCTLSACDSFSRAADAKERLAKAQAMFAERCKTAGVRIHRRVEDVEGVLLLKVRPQAINYGDQFAPDDPYGRDLGGDGYIGSFLRGSYQAETRGTPAPGSPPRLGYLYVEVVDSKNGQRYRYTGGVREIEATSSILVGGTGQKFRTTSFVLDKAPAPGPAPRYGVTYDDISTREEREYWIAGSSLKVIDMQTREVIAERVGYLMDPGQGNISGGRSPWLIAASYACPSFFTNPSLQRTGPGSAAQANQTLDFVESVLQPMK